MTTLQERALAGRTIAVPESRELDVFSAMLERRGATVIRCPLVAILDAPEPQTVLGWIRRFNAGGFDDLILLTGEGLRRLLTCIQRHEPALRDAFVAGLGRVRKITRGPKPARALRELGLKPDIAATTPTTQGVIDALRSVDLQGRRVGVQLYGAQPNPLLMDFLREAGAQATTVAPYVYADHSDDQAVRALLKRMASGEIDVIAFTSAAQVDRLFAVGPEGLVREALSATEVAAVGPVVRDALGRRGVAVRFMPQESFFMKPLMTAIESGLAQE
jgi:uroporphyrinogen-III synthase